MPEIAIQLEDCADSPIVLVQVAEEEAPEVLSATSPERAGLGERLRAAGTAVSEQMTTVAAEVFTESLEVIPHMGDLVLARVKEMREHPREVEVTMAFKISAKGNIKVVEANGEAHIQITLRWAPAAAGD
jgi:exosome complex RNA-binding protein Csl4